MEPRVSVRGVAIAVGITSLSFAPFLVASCALMCAASEDTGALAIVGWASSLVVIVGGLAVSWRASRWATNRFVHMRGARLR